MRQLVKCVRCGHMFDRALVVRCLLCGGEGEGEAALRARIPELDEILKRQSLGTLVFERVNGPDGQPSHWMVREEQADGSGEGNRKAVDERG